jgi:hypothetical protein
LGGRLGIEGRRIWLMRHIRTACRQLAAAAAFLGGWLFVAPSALAGTPQPLFLEENSGAYVQAYAIVALVIAGGAALVSRPSGRSERAHPEGYESVLDRVLEDAQESAKEE